MNESKNFLSRWSQRKLETGDGVTPAETATPDSANAAKAKAVAPPEAEFDPATLPSIESLGAGSDIRAFLQRGVPAALTRAALRRVWSADPSIRNFIGLSENAWDFNAPNSIPGFGDLGLEEAKRLTAQLFEQMETPRSPGIESVDRNPLVQSASDPSESEAPVLHEMRQPDIAATDPGQVQGLQKPEDDKAELPVQGQREVDVAVQYEEEKTEYGRPPSQKRHGRALPE
jgi:hypothetical protein